MFYLVCFDIVDDKTRQRIVKILKGNGLRVQKSVFECSDLTEEKYIKLKAKIDDIIDHTEDNVRFYRLCKNCVAEVEFSGQGAAPDVTSFKVV
jgi:CRISPR-associated protein Cas2